MAFADNVSDLLDALILHFRDVDETVLAAHEVYECAEIDDVDDLAIVDFANFGLFNNAFNPSLSGFDLRAIGRADLDDAFIVNINLRAGFSHDLADNLAACSDDVADLRFVDLHCLDTRRMLGHFAARIAQSLVHLAKDVRAASFRLFHRGFHDLFRDPSNLDVHLKRSNAGFRASHFKVHIAQVIFITQNV